MVALELLRRQLHDSENLLDFVTVVHVLLKLGLHILLRSGVAGIFFLGLGKGSYLPIQVSQDLIHVSRHTLALFKENILLGQELALHS